MRWTSRAFFSSARPELYVWILIKQIRGQIMGHVIQSSESLLCVIRQKIASIKCWTGLGRSVWLSAWSKWDRAVILMSANNPRSYHHTTQWGRLTANEKELMKMVQLTWQLGSQKNKHNLAKYRKSLSSFSLGHFKQFGPLVCGNKSWSACEI